MNKTFQSGHLGQKPELRTTPGNLSVAECNLAVTDGWGDKQKTYWFGLVAWGKTAESMAEHLDKGSKILIEGRLIQDEWEDKETGKKRNKTRIVVERWEFAGGRGEGKSHPDGMTVREMVEAKEAQPQGASVKDSLADGDENDCPEIPF